MNYRHGYHAGNAADVHKHTVLLALLTALQRKPGGLLLLDTHAGRGDYPLDGEQAQKTQEAASGIGRLLAPPPQHPLLQALLRATAAALAQRHYPGSPCLLAQALRAQDRLVACELQDEEFQALRQRLAGQPRVALHHRDGYEALPALLPPAERRGLVLIDPPFEAQRDEFAAVEQALRAALRRWPTGVYALWYPIKRRSDLNPVFRRLCELPVARLLQSELNWKPPELALALNGSGMLILNPPWQLELELAPALQELGRRLDQGGGSVHLSWLKQDDR